MLFEYGKSCYEYLTDNIPDIKTFTTAHISRRDDASTLAMELWDTIGSEFIEKN